MESGQPAPYHQWIEEITKELDFFDLVEIPPIWEQIFTTLPEYLITLKQVDLELLWLFEGTGDDLPDLYFQFTKIKEQLVKRLQKFDPKQLMPFIVWCHSLELKLIERFGEKPVPLSTKITSTKTSKAGTQPAVSSKESWETLFFHLLDMLPLGAVMFSSTGKAVFFNKTMTKLTGIKQSMLQSIEDIRKVIADEEQSIKIYKYFQRALMGEELENVGLVLKTEDDQTVRFHLHTFSCPDDCFMTLLLPEHCHDEDGGTSSSYENGVELNRCAEELKGAEIKYQECMEQLNFSYKIIQRVTWLLKEDIGSFHTYAALIEQEFTGTNDQANDIGAVVQISAALDDMMENLLEFAQLSLGRIHFAPVQWDGSLAADEVFSHLEERLANFSWKLRDITIENRVDGEVSVPLDFRIVTEILWQLTVNALSYSEEAIEVLATVDDQDLVFEVIDRGPGIYATDREKIFLPLVRLEKAKVKGLGLGLAIVQQYCNLSDYRVDLLPNGTKGTVAKLILPGS